MTLAEAKSLIGEAVVYRPRGGPVEQGVVTSVGSSYVFVRYGGDETSKATRAEDIEPLGGGS